MSTEENGHTYSQPPNMPVYQQQPSLGASGGGDHLDNSITLRFKKNRKTAQRCGKGLMYLGYILMFLDGLGVISGVFNIIIYLRYGDDSDPFLKQASKGTIFFGAQLDVIRKVTEFL